MLPLGAVESGNLHLQVHFLEDLSRGIGRCRVVAQVGVQHTGFRDEVVLRDEPMI